MTPLITDWIQAIGVLLGVPVAVWSILSLFRKDKEKEKQINSLSSIATSQNEVVKMLSEQVEQLSIRSGHFQYQSSLMNESNRLVEKQIELQTKMFLQEKGIEEAKMSIEKTKRINEIKPHFIDNGPMSTPEYFKLIFENKGGLAKDIKIIENDTRFAWFEKIGERVNIDKLGFLNIIGGAKQDLTYYSPHNVPFEITIEFNDIDGNEYSQNVRRIQTGRVIIDEPQKKASPQQAVTSTGADDADTKK